MLLDKRWLSEEKPTDCGCGSEGVQDPFVVVSLTPSPCLMLCSYHGDPGKLVAWLWVLTLPEIDTDFTGHSYDYKST